MTAHTDAVAEVACPDCRAPRSSPCVYMTPRAHEYSPEQLARWPSMRGQVERAGQPMAVTHQGRLRAARIKAARRTRRPRGVAPTPEPLRAAWRASLAFDQRENERLRRWLKAWGEELFSAEGRTRRP